MYAADAPAIPFVRTTTAPMEWFFRCLGVVLLGYALFGRGFAYLGLRPVYIGEVTLLIGLVTFMRTHGASAIFQVTPAKMCIPLILWGLFCTLPYVTEYRVDAIRDAVIYLYAIWAFVVGGMIVAEPSLLPFTINLYKRFARIFLPMMIVTWVAFRYSEGILPRLPGSDVPIIVVKAGDVMVHLGAIVAFMVSDLWGRVRWAYLACMPVLLMLGGSTNRGGLLSMLAAFGTAMVLRPSSRFGWRLVIVGALSIAMLALLDIRSQTLTRGDREVSTAQLFENLLSVVEDSGEPSTKTWRLNWWSDIWNYTVEGEYFWTGKGFGINLADEDGYQVVKDSKLRSPHNGHMTMLARAGVPGFVLWILAQITYAGMIFAAFYHSLQTDRRQWNGLFLFLLCFWVAFMANTSFDVFIEGPMGGIWFWCMYGVGLAALYLYDHMPQLLDDESTALYVQPIVAR